MGESAEQNFEWALKNGDLDQVRVIVEQVCVPVCLLLRLVYFLFNIRVAYPDFGRELGQFYHGSPSVCHFIIQFFFDKYVSVLLKPLMCTSTNSQFCRKFEARCILLALLDNGSTWPSFLFTIAAK
jgi:hypothetical protein